MYIYEIHTRVSKIFNTYFMLTKNERANSLKNFKYTVYNREIIVSFIIKIKETLSKLEEHNLLLHFLTFMNDLNIAFMHYSYFPNYLLQS